MAQKASPALQILLFPFGNPEDLTETIRADANGNQHRDVAHLTSLLLRRI